MSGASVVKNQCWSHEFNPQGREDPREKKNGSHPVAFFEQKTYGAGA